MVDTPDSKSGSASCAGSSPATGTITLFFNVYSYPQTTIKSKLFIFLRLLLFVHIYLYIKFITAFSTVSNTKKYEFMKVDTVIKWQR